MLFELPSCASRQVVGFDSWPKMLMSVRRPPWVSPAVGSLCSISTPPVSCAWNQRLFSTSVGCGGPDSVRIACSHCSCGTSGLRRCSAAPSRPTNRNWDASARSPASSSSEPWFDQDVRPGEGGRGGVIDELFVDGHGRVRRRWWRRGCCRFVLGREYGVRFLAWRCVVAGW